MKTLAQVHQPSVSGAETGSWVGLSPELLEHSHQWCQNLELAVPKGSVSCGHRSVSRADQKPQMWMQRLQEARGGAGASPPAELSKR